jgi:hypothetical protein
MFKHVVFRILAGLVLLAAIAGIAFFAYNAGIAQGATVNVQVPPAQAEVQNIPLYAHGMFMARAHPFFGFGCFGILIPLFLLFLAFAAMRHLIWGPRWGEHHMRFARHMHDAWGEDGVPPMFAELHRRAHAQPPADDTAKK